ncbi:MAG: mechanosensitive ion channel family protein [Leptodesmis sp.]|uniref:mechanosensitive ion channel family protein n=1 Tax=Leptodesmis sp. TaxID=3100501 RepID=UPI003D1110C6
MPGLPSPSTPQLPLGVQRSGLVESTPVLLDGKEVFKIASPTVLNRAEPGQQVPVEVRARQIEMNLAQLLAPNPVAERSASYSTLLDPQTTEVLIENLNSQPVLFVRDAHLAEPRVLLTVTDADAQYYATTKAELAQRWQATLQQELRQALESRQPGARKERLNQVAISLATMVAASLVLFGVWKLLGWRKRLLEQRQIEQRQRSEATTSAINAPLDSPAAAIALQEAEAEETGLQFLEILREQLSLQRRLRILDFLRWLVFWAIIFVWVSGIANILSWFPETRRFATVLGSIPSVILVAWFFAGLIDRLIHLGVDRFAKAWELNSSSTENSQRRSLRISTLVAVVKGLTTLLVYITALMWVLQSLNVAPISVLALGTVLAVAASFATQNIIKDFVNGFLILLEDQYAIGDFIRVNNVSGRVEGLNLRVTQLRNDTGHLITIPNSLIAQVENMTRTWSRCDFQIEVAYNTDVNLALDVIRQVADELAHDPEWGKFILDTTEVLGVEQLSHSGILIRLWIKTLPMKQWPVAREFRRRIKIAFDKQGIAIGMPQQSLIGPFIERTEKN